MFNLLNADWADPSIVEACGVITRKTMPLTMFNLLMDQEKPEYYY